MNIRNTKGWQMTVARTKRRQAESKINQASKASRAFEKPLGGWLAAFQEAIGMSAPALADRLGISRNSYPLELIYPPTLEANAIWRISYQHVRTHRVNEVPAVPVINRYPVLVVIRFHVIGSHLPSGRCVNIFLWRFNKARTVSLSIL